MIRWTKCSGSGTEQVADWFPDDEGYPGAAVCIGCSYGVMFRKGSITSGVTQSGFETEFGVLRNHYVKWDVREPVKMTYTKPKVVK